MADTSTVPAKPIDEKREKSTRFTRGVALAQEHFAEIVRIAPWLWEVSSCSSEHRYVVDLKHGRCSCPDYSPEGEECKHTVAARWVGPGAFGVPVLCYDARAHIRAGASH